MTEEKEDEKNTEMVVLTVVCEIEPVNGDVEHVWALPLHRRYMVPKVSAKEREEATKDIRVSPGMWRFLKNIEHEILMETDEVPSMDEILRANKLNITPEAVKEMWERQKGVPVAADGGGEEKKRKSLLEVAIVDKDKRGKKE